MRPRTLALAVGAALAAFVVTANAGTGTDAGSYSLGELDLPSMGGVSATSADTQAAQTLYLDVYRGDRALGQLVRVQLRDGRLFATPDDLRQLGMVIAPALPTDEAGLLALDAIPGLRFQYDIEGQRLILDVAPELRPNQPLGYRMPEAVTATRSAGFLLTYDAYGRSLHDEDTLSLATTARVFGRFGALENSFLSRAGDNADAYQRLDTRWIYSDAEHMTTWTAGDFIGGGLGWTRPVRLGGLQVRRNFGVRPDLITFPVPRFTGQATVPSSVELLVDNVKQFGADVDDGPFVLDSFPRITGAGEATLVVRDALGRTTQTSVPIYVDYQRLAPGLSDFSLEAGRLRLGYATNDDSYGDDWVASGSYRRGLSMSLTGEAHAEYAPGLRVAGGGIVWSPAGHVGVITASLARSEGDDSGDQRTVGYQWMNPHFGFDLKTQRRSRGFRDLGDLADGGAPNSLRAQDQASTWWSMSNGSLAFSWVRWRNQSGDEERVRTVTWSQLFGRMNTSVGVFDSADSGHGFNINLSLPLGSLRDSSLSVSHSGDRTDTVAAVRQSPGYDGGWGWELQAGNRDGGYGLASTTVRGRYGEATFGADHRDGSTGYFGQANGSLVWMGGSAFASRRVGDSFAVVSTQGVAGVPVLYENRLFGATNERGFLLLPDLRGWQRNRVAMDPDALGADYRIPPLEQMVTPADHGGVLVRFDVARVHPALVTLQGPSGAFVPAGAQGRIVGSGASFLVGLDGEAYVDDLPAGGVLEVETAGTVCRYALPAQLPASGGVVRLGPLRCGEPL